MLLTFQWPYPPLLQFVDMVNMMYSVWGQSSKCKLVMFCCPFSFTILLLYPTNVNVSAKDVTGIFVRFVPWTIWRCINHAFLGNFNHTYDFKNIIIAQKCAKLLPTQFSIRVGTHHPGTDRLWDVSYKDRGDLCSKELLSGTHRSGAHNHGIITSTYVPARSGMCLHQRKLEAIYKIHGYTLNDDILYMYCILYVICR